MMDGLFDVEPVVKSLLHETPIWAILLVIFRICWVKVMESRKEAIERLKRIEASVETMEKILLKADPEGLKKAVEELKKTQVSQQIEMTSLWEMGKHLRRLRPHDHGA